MSGGNYQGSYETQAGTRHAEEEDSVQVLLCGTSNEGTITDFAREQNRFGGGASYPFSPHAAVEAAPATDADYLFEQAEGGEANFPSQLDATAQRPATEGAGVGENIEGLLECSEDPAGGTATSLLSSLSGQSKLASSQSLLRSPSERLDASLPRPEGAEAAARAPSSLPARGVPTSSVPDVDAATAEGKVVMEWEVSRDRKWLYARDKSQWFNYGFDETTFREWIQKLRDERVARLAHRSVLVAGDEPQSAQHFLPSGPQVFGVHAPYNAQDPNSCHR
ncbi:conserved hypothetical protein [Neospora caninum Liverpool]|uniref:Pre-mRNA polyadenylation factor Fip1 domain-containing protein n=1 Tax=Neospora caninum (strain Liverpool) TaxID=572307 RepID=F0VHU0_NEOCL|nr:conserved hypothetical protein [Neospora caninum Liverpool]CBZ53301.1 conserved hypothetical protein [Neospora caninum Liverpool]CEL67287.1 TPA: hypothetical protein BN1204_030880 [Neospora caninum Liverpool]|eukprot:XP_003883333.1 conserved hypothetical protein [Neospora caninum Liverpool]